MHHPIRAYLSALGLIAVFGCAITPRGMAPAFGPDAECMERMNQCLADCPPRVRSDDPDSPDRRRPLDADDRTYCQQACHRQCGASELTIE